MHLIEKNDGSIQDSTSVPGKASAAAMMTHLLGHSLLFTDSSQNSLQNGLEFSLLSTVKLAAASGIKLALVLCLLPILVRGYRHFQTPKLACL